MKSKTLPTLRGKTFMAIYLEFLEAALRFEQAKPTTASPADGAKAFAVSQVEKESSALGLRLLEVTKSVAGFRKWHWRLQEWRMTYLKLCLMCKSKSCPIGSHPDTQIAAAAQAGNMLNAGHGDTLHVKELLSHFSELSPAALKVFKQWVSKPQPAAWKHPELDSWLSLIWPLVTEYEWTPREVWLVASEKFYGRDLSKYPLADAKMLTNHCKLTLNLRTNGGAKAGRPFNDEWKLPKLAVVALSTNFN